MSQQSTVGDLAETPNPKKAKMSRRYVIILGAVVFTIAAGVAVIFSVADQKQAKRNAIQMQCSGSKAEATYAALMAANQGAVLSQAEEIRKLPAYEGDINCLYVVTEADIAMGDVESAVKHNDQLQVLAKQGNVLDGAYSNGAALLVAINESVTFMRDYKMDSDGEGDPINEVSQNER